MTIYFIYSDTQNATSTDLAEAKRKFESMTGKVHLHAEEYASQEDFEAGNMAEGRCLEVKEVA